MTAYGIAIVGIILWELVGAVTDWGSELTDSSVWLIRLAPLLVVRLAAMVQAWKMRSDYDQNIADFETAVRHAAEVLVTHNNAPVSRDQYNDIARLISTRLDIDPSRSSDVAQCRVGILWKRPKGGFVVLGTAGLRVRNQNHKVKSKIGQRLNRWLNATGDVYWDQHDPKSKNQEGQEDWVNGTFTTHIRNRSKKNQKVGLVVIQVANPDWLTPEVRTYARAYAFQLGHISLGSGF